MELENLLNKPLPQIPPEISEALNKKQITKTSLENKNDILSNGELQTVVGYTEMDDGTYLVSMICPMPGITVEMIEWWFWWHTQLLCFEKLLLQMIWQRGWQNIAA